MTVIEQMGVNAKQAARVLAALSSKQKDDALNAAAVALTEHQEEILRENRIDLENAEKAGLSAAMQDRLRLTPERIQGMADGIREVMALADPIGKVMDGTVRPNGLQIDKVRVPLGVIGIIFESRPNVTADAAALCLKSGNAVILRGGKEAIHSNIVIAQIMRQAIERAGLPKDAIQLVEDTTRKSSEEMMKLQALDVLIPRGGAGLIRAVVENASVPVIETGAGNCHVYVDKDADCDMAADIIFNAKTSRPSVCNAIETILVHKDIAEKVLPVIKARLDEKSVVLHGDERTCAILEEIIPATDEDWGTEYLSYDLAVRVVDSIEQAEDHIAKYSTGHSECIVTENYAAAQRFLREVDAAAVYVNASTRFTDGGQFGLGAEIGISTQKLHARGPMGLNELTSMKYLIRGSGQIR